MKSPTIIYGSAVKSATIRRGRLRHRRAESTPRSKDKNMDDAQQRIRSAQPI
jgi:hypothetical protein